MRDQTWKVLQYTILFFIGVVGLELKAVDKAFMIPAYVAVLVTSVFGTFVALHHRRRQNEKFEMIKILERELGLYELIKPVLKEAHKTWTGRINTAVYIVVMQACLFLVSAFLLVRAVCS